TVETVSKFTLCETLKGFMQGFAPHPTRGSAKGLLTLWKPIFYFLVFINLTPHIFYAVLLIIPFQKEAYLHLPV
ncbi:MAG TPA: hypothetical protein PLF24_02365, partial [Ruminococcus sp.]|nr:hypothetical protein [Ruminococcus sp.]